MKNKKSKFKLAKRLKPFSVCGIHPLRILNPFTWKRLNLEKLYNTIYLFNKITKADFKPIPYSEKLTTIEKKLNKEIVESIIYELRLFFGSYLIIILLYVYWLITTGLKFSILHTFILTLMLIIFVVIIRVTIKLLSSNKNECDIIGNNDQLVEQYIYKEEICENIKEQNNNCTIEPTNDIKSILNKVRSRKKIKSILNAYKRFNKLQKRIKID